MGVGVKSARVEVEDGREEGVDGKGEGVSTVGGSCFAVDVIVSVRGEVPVP